jgi:hypothetical protein
MKSGWLRRNGLSLALAALFLATWAFGQFAIGRQEHNRDRIEHGMTALTVREYATSAHFVEATMENWESEFFQMFVYVYITSFLFQRGSAESNDPDRSVTPREILPNSPWPVRRGGWWRRIYNHSLSLAFAVLFLVSFWLHLDSSRVLYNQQRAWAGRPPLSLSAHFASARFWFESFQNWQSEFLAILSMVVLTIFLREKGSPESKPVEAPHSETGA